MWIRGNTDCWCFLNHWKVDAIVFHKLAEFNCHCRCFIHITQQSRRDVRRDVSFSLSVLHIVFCWHLSILWLAQNRGLVCSIPFHCHSKELFVNFHSIPIPGTWTSFHTQSLLPKSCLKRVPPTSHTHVHLLGNPSSNTHHTYTHSRADIWIAHPKHLLSLSYIFVSSLSFLPYPPSFPFSLLPSFFTLLLPSLLPLSLLPSSISPFLHRAHTLLPEAKLIIILHNPIKRAYSWYQVCVCLFYIYFMCLHLCIMCV